LLLVVVAVPDEEILFQQDQEELEAEEMAVQLDTAQRYTPRMGRLIQAAAAVVEQALAVTLLRRLQMEQMEALDLFTFDIQTLMLEHLLCQVVTG
jgi:hypothetical protein